MWRPWAGNEESSSETFTISSRIGKKEVGNESVERSLMVEGVHDII